MSIPELLRTETAKLAKAAIDQGEFGLTKTLLAFLEAEKPSQAVSPSRQPVQPDKASQSDHDLDHPPEFWLNLITDDFIPGLLRRKITTFSTGQLLGWIENRDDICFTPSELEMSGTSLRWRRHVSRALTDLRQRGFIEAMPKSSLNQINAAAFSTDNTPSTIQEAEAPETLPLDLG